MSLRCHPCSGGAHRERCRHHVVLFTLPASPDITGDQGGGGGGGRLTCRCSTVVLHCEACNSSARCGLITRHSLFAPNWTGGVL